MTPTSMQIAGWLICLVAVAAGINQVLRLVDRFRETPHPPDTYVTKEFCSNSHGSVGRRVDQVEADVRAIRAEMKTDRDAVLSLIREEVGGVHTRIDLSDRDMPMRIVTLLKNTGAIK